MTIGFGMIDPVLNEPRHPWYQKHNHVRIPKVAECKKYLDATWVGGGDGEPPPVPMPPVNTSLPVIDANSPLPGATYTVTPGTWTHSPVLTYIWYVNNVPTASTGTVFTPAPNLENNDIVKVQEIATNIDGTANVLSNSIAAHAGLIVDEISGNVLGDRAADVYLADATQACEDQSMPFEPPIYLQDLVGEGNAAYIEPLSRVIKGLAVIDVGGAPTPSWVARKGVSGWEFPTDAQMYGYGEAANPLLVDPATLALTSNTATYTFATYRKVKTAAPAAATTIAASTLAAVQSRWPGGGMIKFPMGATAFAITPGGTGYVEHGRPTIWVANQDYIALIVKFDVPHVFWLAPGVRH